MKKKLKSKKPIKKAAVKAAAKKKTATRSTKAIKKPEHISPSQIERGKCLYKYEQTYLLKKYDDESEPMRVGKCAHQIIYAYTDYLFKNRINSDFEEMERLVNFWFAEYNLQETGFRDLRSALIEFGERGIEVENLLGYEREATIEFAPGYKVKIIIDRVNSYIHKTRGACLEVIDYKNQMNILSKTEIDQHEQLQIYKWAAARHLFKGYDYIRVGIHHIKYNYVVTSDWQKVSELEKEFENMESYLIRQSDRLLKSKNYPPQRSNACSEYGGCVILKAGKCKLFSKAEMTRVITGSDPAEIIRVLRGAEVIVNNCKAKLKAAVGKDNFLMVDGKMYGYIPAESYRYDIEKAFDFCRNRGIDIQSITGFTKSAFEASVKKQIGHEAWKVYQDELFDARIEMKSTRFKT